MEFADAAPAPGEEVVAEDIGAAFTTDQTEFNVFNTDRKLSASYPYRNSCAKFRARNPSFISRAGSRRRRGESVTIGCRCRCSQPIERFDLHRGCRGLYATIRVAMRAWPPRWERPCLRALRSSAKWKCVTRHATRWPHWQPTPAGERFRSGDFSEVFRRVQEEERAYYLLGYYSTDSKHDGRWRRVRVKVMCQALTCNTARGTTQLRTTAPRRGSKQQLDQAMRAEARAWNFRSRSRHLTSVNEREFFVPVAAKVIRTALEWLEKSASTRRDSTSPRSPDEQSHRIVSAHRLNQDQPRAERFQQFSAGHCCTRAA